MKTVMQVVQHLSPGGLEIMALELKKINDLKATNMIVSLEGTKEESLTKWPRLKEIETDIVFLNKKSGFRPSVVFKLLHLFLKHSPESVHTHHIGPLIYAGLAARMANIRNLIHTEHDAWHLEDRKRSLVQRAIVAITKPTIIADAESVAQGLRHHLKCDEITVVQNGIDIDRFSPGSQKSSRRMLGLPLDKNIIGCSGRMVEIKGQNNALKALQKLPKDAHLAIAGTGELMESLRALAETLGITNRVHFLGHVEDMPCFYRSLDVFCLPSLREGMPLSPLEAQACGIPAVISDTGGSTETLCHKSGVLVTPGDSVELSKALEGVLYNRRDVSPRPFVEQSGNIQLMANAYAKLCNLEGELAS